MFDGVPQRVQVDFVVAVDKSVPHAASKLPRHGRIPLLAFSTGTRRGFADDLT